MGTLDGTSIALWEAAATLDPHTRAATLAAAVTAVPTAAVLEWPLGRRDAALLDLVDDTAGPSLAAVATCPGCGESVEFELATTDLRERADGATTATAGDDPTRTTLHSDTWSVTCRTPTTADLVAVAEVASDDADGGDVALLARITHSDEPAQDDLPGAARAAIQEWIVARDPLVEVVVTLDCPACGGRCDAQVDIAAHAWAAVAAHATGLLREVDVLARTYGWGEAEVLALSPARRATYVRMARGEVAHG